MAKYVSDFKDFSEAKVQKIWTIKGSVSGRILDGWYNCEDGECPITANDLEFYENEWGEICYIHLGWGVVDYNNNVGEKWFYDSVKQANLDLENLLGNGRWVKSNESR
jgi:hypothetical protein